MNDKIVYVIETGEYSDRYIMAVTMDKEKAEWIERKYGSVSDPVHVTEYVLDEDIPEEREELYLVYKVVIDDKGQIKSVKEAIHCMKSYVPDQGEYYRCFRCPYYGSKQVEHRDNVYTCQSSRAHTMAIEALEKMLQDQRSKEEEHIQYLKSQKEFIEKDDGGFIFRFETDPYPNAYEQIYNFIRRPDVEFYSDEEKAKIFKLMDEIAEEDRDKLKVRSGPTVADGIYPAQDLVTTGIIANGKHYCFRMMIEEEYHADTPLSDLYVTRPDGWEVRRCYIWEEKE